MAVKEHTTAAYRVIADSGGSRYRFFCDVSGMALCTTKHIRRNTQEEELAFAWESEGRQHFNRCGKCGKWVSDPMYNADLLQCVDCAPWKELPRYCSRCGNAITAAARFCTTCGTPLHREEVVG